jgi:hypothetical protein
MGKFYGEIALYLRIIGSVFGTNGGTRGSG